jgi:hypothetical protein
VLDIFKTFNHFLICWFQTIGEDRIKRAVEKAFSKDDADLITAKVLAQLDKERRELELEYQKKVN